MYVSLNEKIVVLIYVYLWKCIFLPAIECQIPESSQTSQLNFAISSVDRATVGTNITYFCNEGYKLTGGDNTATCTSSGEWSSQIPSCASGR